MLMADATGSYLRIGDIVQNAVRARPAVVFLGGGEANLGGRYHDSTILGTSEVPHSPHAPIVLADRNRQFNPAPGTTGKMNGSQVPQYAFFFVYQDSLSDVPSG